MDPGFPYDPSPETSTAGSIDGSGASSIDQNDLQLNNFPTLWTFPDTQWPALSDANFPEAYWMPGYAPEQEGEVFGAQLAQNTQLPTDYYGHNDGVPYHFQGLRASHSMNESYDETHPSNAVVPFDGSTMPGRDAELVLGVTVPAPAKAEEMRKTELPRGIPNTLGIPASYPPPYKCLQCGQIFEYQTQLNHHVLSSSHAAFKCTEGECQGTFTRLDVYQRHLLSHTDNVRRYPCPHCKSHRGDNGFKRKDHLTQHLRNYHLIGLDNELYCSGRSCPHKGCPDYRENLSKRSWDHAFKKVSEYTAHMRKVHNESPFPCPEPGCDRVAGRGYFRMRDLIKHRQSGHSKEAD